MIRSWFTRTAPSLPRRPETGIAARLALLLGLFLLASLAVARAAVTSVERVSLSSSGLQGNGQCDRTAISADGRFVAFESVADNLVPNDTNRTWDIFVRDRQTGTTERVSVDSAGGQGRGGGSFSPTISSDGRLVAFWSNGEFVPGVRGPQIFVHDRQTGVTDLASLSSAEVAANFISFDPALSGDGRFVAFVSSATNLVPGDTNSTKDIFVRDRQLGTTERVSVTSAGVQANQADSLGDTFDCAISRDGRFVAFHTTATNLVAGDTNASVDVFVRDRQAGTTERVSVSTAGAQGNSGSLAPGISADGRFVIFSSTSSNLAPGDTNVEEDVFVHDRQTGQTRRVSLDSADGQANRRSFNAAISDNGRFVAFASGATNLTPGDTGGFDDTFVRDRDSDGNGVFDEPGQVSTEKVSVNTAGIGGDNNSNPFGRPSIHADGSSIAFSSFARNLVTGDTNNQADVFVVAYAPGSGNRPPTANAGPDQVLECRGALTVATLDGSGSTDPDGGALSFTWREGATILGTGSPLTVGLPVGVHTLTLTVTDPGGLTATDTVAVTIRDTTPPVVTCPANLTVDTAPGQCFANVSPEMATALDACDGALPVTAARSDSLPLGDPYPVGVTTITWSATDRSGNRGTCPQTVTVADREPPMVTCPANVAVTGAGPTAVSYNATAADNCPGVKLTCLPPSGAVFPLGTTTVTCTARDASGNQASCTFTVTVTGPPDGPDLVGAWSETSVTFRKSGRTTVATGRGTLTVTNRGNRSAGLSRIRFFFSRDAVFDPGDVQFANKRVPSLRAGRSLKVKFLVSVQGAQADALHGQHVIAVLDADRQVTESNETNNPAAFGPIP